MKGVEAVEILGIVSSMALIAGNSALAAGVDRNTETLWRGALRGDSLLVRATWVPTAGSSWCVAFMGGTFEGDASAIRPKYIDYSIVDGLGNVRSRDVLSEPDSQFCCDGLTAEGVPWSGGLVIKLTAYGWGCEPAGDCEETRFIYLAGKDSVANSEWTDIPWNPAVEGLTEAWVSEGCLEYPMTLKARVLGATIVFEPTFPLGVKVGDLFEKPLDEMYVYCARLGSPKEPKSIELFRTPGSNAPDRLLIRAEDPIKILSAVVRAERTRDGRLIPKLFRLGIRAAGRLGFVTPSSLKSVGFLGF